MNSIDKSELSAALKTQWLGRRFEVYQSIESTNTRLIEMAKVQAPSGTMILAEYQSSGKGRLGRRWDAPAGSSLLFSLLFRPDWPADRAQWLMMIASLSVVQAIRAVTGLDIRLKWPNDIVIGDSSDWRKCGGILLEGEIDESLLKSAVVGIGINVNTPLSDLADTAPKATSLEVEAGYILPRIPLLADILRIMELRYEQASAGQSPLADWKSALINLGHKVRVSSASGDSPVEGTAVDTDELGRLLIRDHAGKIHKMAAGDVTVLG
jgi:BirA family biotin operon repressor/biotin-[acetyl-CoA-carboxylase] ligase